MSTLDQIRKLEEQKNQLLNQAKQEALNKANDAIKELRELGFEYQLVQGDTPTATVRGSGKRRTGIRDDVLEHVTKAKDGITRADLLEQMGAKGDKSSEQSISNALAALKKQGTVTLNDGVYRSA